MMQWRDGLDAVYGTSSRGTFAVLKSFNERVGIVTGNLTTPYIFNFEDLSDGPVVIDYPAGPTAGGILDFWQRPVADLGQTGPDAGKGATYLVVGPNDDPAQYQGRADHIIQSPTNNIFIGIRLRDDSPELAKAFEAGLKVGALDGDMVDSTFIIDRDEPWVGTAPRGLDYFRLLAEAINQEPVREQDKIMIAMLEPLGIVTGEPFAPTDDQVKLLTEGAALGELMVRNIQINPRFAEPYWEGTNWFKSFDFSIPQITDTKVELDERALWFYEAVTSTEGMVNPPVGKGQVYMTAKRDVNGDLLRADKTYRLTVPADVPVSQFWSLTLYSEDTRRPYESAERTIESANKNSRRDLVVNEDGSVHIFIVPDAPEGFEQNHMPTEGENGWFTYFRLYGPLEAWFDKSWELPDFVPVN